MDLEWKCQSKVKSMQRSGTEAITAQIQLSKREITNITNSQNTKRTYGQPSEQIFPKRWPLSIQNQTKNNMNTHMLKHHRNSDTKNRQQRTTKNYHLRTVRLKHVLRRQPRPQFLKCRKTFSWLFVLHDNPLIRQ